VLFLKGEDKKPFAFTCHSLLCKLETLTVNVKDILVCANKLTFTVEIWPNPNGQTLSSMYCMGTLTWHFWIQHTVCWILK